MIAHISSRADDSIPFPLVHTMSTFSDTTVRLSNHLMQQAVTEEVLVLVFPDSMLTPSTGRAFVWNKPRSVHDIRSFEIMDRPSR